MHSIQIGTMKIGVRNTFGTSYIELMGRLMANIELNARCIRQCKRDPGREEEMMRTIRLNFRDQLN